MENNFSDEFVSNFGTKQTKEELQGDVKSPKEAPKEEKPKEVPSNKEAPKEVPKSIRVVLTDREWLQYRILDENLSKVCSELLKKYLTDKKVRDKLEKITEELKCL